MENKALYEARLKNLRNQLSNLRGERRIGREEGIQIGIERGIAKGVEEGIQMVAKRMLQEGMSLSKIAEVTGVSEEKIHELED